MFNLTIEPRFCETDAFGHINNTVIAAWFETARQPIFKMFAPDMDVKKLSIILARIDIDFVAQTHYGMEVSINTWIEKIGNSSFTVAHEAMQNGIVVAKGKAIQVYFEFELQKSGPIPAVYREMLEEHLVDSSSQ